MSEQQWVQVARAYEMDDLPLEELDARHGDASYVHTQSAAASEWTVAHGLGKRPAVTVVDTSGREVLGGIVHVSADALTLTFSSPFSGAAYCN